MYVCVCACVRVWVRVTVYSYIYMYVCVCMYCICVCVLYVCVCMNTVECYISNESSQFVCLFVSLCGYQLARFACVGGHAQQERGFPSAKMCRRDAGTGHW